MDFRQRLEQNRIFSGGNDISSGEPVDDVPCPYFAADRIKNPVCIELRLSDGNRHAFPYSYVTEITFELEKGIEILTSQKRIAITGRNLTKLFESLITYRVRYVQGNMGNDSQEDGLYVSGILIEGL
jgi:hypothetical protein